MNLNISTQLADIFAVILVFLFITFLHVVIGISPKNICDSKAEQVSLFVAKPLTFFYRMAFPFIWLLNGSPELLRSC